MLKNWRLKREVERGVVGTPCFDPAVFDAFLRAPADVHPGFTAAPGREHKPASGRGRDHPRYGRFVYAFARVCRPECIVEVGTSAGGTAVGWARALVESGRGRLICVDNDSYSTGTFPETARRNIDAVGLPPERYELWAGDARIVLPELVAERRGEAEIYLVDGDHTFEGATADLEQGLPLVRPGGYLLVHDLDRGWQMDEATTEHPHPVHEAFMRFVESRGYEWCILEFIRRHLGVIRLPG